jgi:hypothetical protein
MSEEYIRHVFDAIDGNLRYDKLGKKKRGRKAGYKHSEETKQKIAEKMRGRVKPKEIRAKISKSLQGRPKPDEVKEKISISKTQHSILEDLLNQYGGMDREKDIPVSTVEWLDKCGHSKEELCTWIMQHSEAIDSFDDVRTESFLTARAIKEEARLEQDFSKYQDEWR